MDLIVCNQTYQTGLPRYLWYYENTGSATNPFLKHVQGAQNPFDTVGAVMDAHPQNFNTGFYPLHNLVDIDADGDLDNLVFYDDKYTDFYLNVGTATNPDFVLQPSSSNPLDFLAGTSIDFQGWTTQQFVDFDSDGDFDFSALFSINTFHYITMKIRAILSMPYFHF